jgi:hypothetical protein
MIIFEPHKAQWLLYVPPGLAVTNSTFCQYCVFVCFVWISEQTAVISLYSINRLIFITETERLHCAVRTELCMSEVKSLNGGLSVSDFVT